MSDSEDDAVPRQKSIFSTMNRVRNMNHLREKWTARAKLSSSSGSTELESSASSAPGSVGSLKKRSAAASTVSSVSRPAEATAARAVSPVVTPTLTPVEEQRFATLVAWMQRSGLVVEPAVSGADVFDTLYASLDEMEAAVTRELSVLFPSPATEKVPPSGLGASPLVDYMVVVGPDIGDLATHAYWLGQENVFEATVVFAHPPQAQFNAECIEQFCFPRGVHADRNTANIPETTNEFFVLVLSGGGDQGQSVQYACCLRNQIAVNVLEAKDSVVASRIVAVCYAVVVSVPWIPFYHQLLRHLAARHQEELWRVKSGEAQTTIVPDTLAQHIDSMMSALGAMELPARGQELRFTFPPDGVFACVRPRIDTGAPETVALLLDWTTRQLLSVLSVERLIMVIGLLLVEMKVIVVSKSMLLLSAGTVGLATLLHPLSWAGPLITILPPALHEYLEAPVPLLCGVDVLPDPSVLTKGTAILVMETDEIQFHPEDAAQVGALQFPGNEVLSRQLRAFSDRLLKVSPSAQSHVVIANFVARRIRCKLQDLLGLCVRVNPCNAYACMKQEQLSPSETLFLKSFMQSQMYQKYSDDQLPSEPLQQQNNIPDGPPPREDAKTDPRRPLDAVSRLSTPLRSSIRDLFMLAMTGSCSSSGILPSPMPHLVASDPCLEIRDEDNCSEGYAEQLSVKSTQSSDSSNSSKTAVEGSSVPGEQNGLQSRVDDTQNQSVPENARFIQRAHSLTLDPHATPTANVSYGGSEASQNGGEVKSQSTPASPDKLLDNQYPRAEDEAHFNATRSMPDVLVISEGKEKPSIQADTESLVSTSKLTPISAEWNIGDDHVERIAEEYPDGSCLQDTLVLTQNAAALRIQAVWRNHRQKVRIMHRTPSLSAGSVRSASETTIPTTTGDWTPAELHFGTILSMHTDCGKLLDVRVRLGPDATDLQWFHADKLRGSIALADVQEVKARDGIIFIQSSTSAQLAFSVPPHSASGVMAFFQGLHRLATSTSSGLPSPAPSMGNSAHNSHTHVVAHHEPACGEVPTVLKQISHDHNRIQAIDDNEVEGTSVLSFEDVMRRGILVLKHGRLGRPHVKYLVCDDLLQLLSWIDPTVTNAGFLPRSQQASRNDKKGLRFDDITEVVRGKRTRVLQRSSADRSNAEMCFSVVTRARTLDIEAFSREDFTLLYDGILQRVAACRTHREQRGLGR